MEVRSTRRNLVALTVLGMLSEGPSHTYEIQRQIRIRHKDFAAGKTRALYHAIDELVSTGLAEPVETSRDGRRPERTVYQITEAGQAELTAWLTDLLENPVAEYPVFNVAVGFLVYVSQDRALEALRTRGLALRAEIACHQESLRSLAEQLKLPRLVLLELEHAIAMRRAELDWVNAVVSDIHRGLLHWDQEWLAEQFAIHQAIEADSQNAEEGETS